MGRRQGGQGPSPSPTPKPSGRKKRPEVSSKANYERNVIIGIQYKLSKGEQLRRTPELLSGPTHTHEPSLTKKENEFKTTTTKNGMKG